VSTRCLAHLLFLPSPENSFLDGELEEATTKKFLVVRQEGMRRDRRRLKHYNLDALLSVGGAHKVAGFLCSPDNINPPLKNSFTDGVMAEEASTKDSSVVRRKGQSRVRRRGMQSEHRRTGFLLTILLNALNKIACDMK